jgi:hypothetical protein
MGLRHRCGGNTRVTLDIIVFLSISGNEAVQKVSIVDIPNHGDLWPPIGPNGRQGHKAVLIKQLKD